MDRDVAVLQAGFLLANKLCSPSSLYTLQKGDWCKVRAPILDAVTEVCGQGGFRHDPNKNGRLLKNKLICTMWLKLLCEELGEDVEMTWRFSPFFALQNSLPDLNRVALVELVKSLGAAGIFIKFLRCLPQAQICSELEQLAHHVKTNPTSEEDVRLFLDVWWELWRNKDTQKTGEESKLEAMFNTQVARLFSEQTISSLPVAKRPKLDTSDLLPPVSQRTGDVLRILLDSLKDMRDQAFTPDLCLQALSTSLDSIFTSFLDQDVTLPIKKKVDYLSKVVAIRQKEHEELTLELLVAVQRDLCASHSASPFQPCQVDLCQSLEVVAEVAQFWNNSGLLKSCDDSNWRYLAFKFQQSVHRVLEALNMAKLSETIDKRDDVKTQSNLEILRAVLESLRLSDPEVSPKVTAKITMLVINHHLEDYHDFAQFFACEMSWDDSDEHWVDCLEKNQEAFKQPDVVIKLSSSLMKKIQNGNVNQSRRMKNVIVTIFSAFSLEFKNRALKGMLELSGRGFFGGPVPPAISQEFEQELNFVFNSIIQPDGGASAMNEAVSLVAKVALQNPKTTVKSCCHSAVFNKGAYSFMADILQQLPGLSGSEGNSKAQLLEGESGEREEDGEQAQRIAEVWRESSMLCKCLQETIDGRVLSDTDKEQFLKFLGLLMKPVVVAMGEERRQSLLSSEEVVKGFVLPNLSTEGYNSIDVELSLQLLHNTLLGDAQQSTSPHWILSCSPFPLLYVLVQLLHQSLWCLEEPAEVSFHHLSMDTRELTLSVLSILGEVVGSEVASNPQRWSRALFWLYSSTEELDWTVRFYLKPIWGSHFKTEVPSSLLAVCNLPEEEWSGLDISTYSQGTGLLAWLECCCVSDSLQHTMLSHLALNPHQPDHMIMFSKGLLLALTQVLPCCTVSQWSRLLRALRELMGSSRLYVPYSLEYVDHLPLLDLRGFSCELQLSVLLLRCLQFLCGCSCSEWLSAESWSHVCQLYAQAIREIVNSLKARMPHALMETSEKKAGSQVSQAPRQSQHSSVKVSSTSVISSSEAQNEELQKAPSQEVLFVLTQLFCHVQHVQVMMPEGQTEPLFLTSLEILSHCEAVMAAYPHSSSPLESDNTRKFLFSITENLESTQMKTVLQQKISRLKSATA